MEQDRAARFWGTALAIVLLSAAVWITYGGGLDVPFQLDDGALIVNNPYVSGSAEASGGRWSLVEATYRFDWRRGGGESRAFHVTNISLHNLVVVSLYFLLLLLGRAARLPEGRPLRWAFWSALLFAVHPVDTEAVTYIGGRPECLAALLTLWALIAWLCAIRLKGKWKIVPVLAALLPAVALAFISLRTALVPPLLMAACALTVPEEKTARRAGLLLALPFAAPPVFLLIASPVPVAGASVGLAALPGYLGLLLLPLGQTVAHEFSPPASHLDWKIVISAALLATALFLAWRLRRSRPAYAYGLLWIILTLAPALWLSGAFVERVLYLPAMGVSWIFAGLLLAWAGLEETGRSRLLKYTGGGALVLAAAALFLVAVNRNRVWSTPVALWKNVLEKSPKNKGALLRLANAYMDEGREKEALKTYAELLTIHPENLEGHYRLGMALMKSENYVDALEQFESVLAVDSCNIKALYKIAEIHEKHDKSGEGPQKAEERYRDILRCDPKQARALYHLGLLQAATDMPVPAVGFFERAVEADPDFYEAHEKLAIHYIVFFPDTEKARRHVEAMRRIRPNACTSYIWDGKFLTNIGDYRGAVKAYQDGIARQPRCARLYMYLGSIYEMLHQSEKANYYYHKAVSLDPGLARPKVINGPPPEGRPAPGAPAR